MNLKAFTKALGEALYPNLREAGFKGSGTTLRLIDGPVTQVFNVQGSSGGQGCYINLGIHLQQSLRRDGEPYDATTIEPTSCLIYQRFRPTESFREWQAQTDRKPSSPERWSYGTTPSELDTSVESLVTQWNERGMPYLQRLRNYPADFTSAVTDTDYTGYGDLYDSYRLDHIGFRPLTWLAEHFELPAELALIQAEAATYSAAQRAVHAARMKKLRGG